jgi:hypothetical protein
VYGLIIIILLFQPCITILQVRVSLERWCGRALSFLPTETRPYVISQGCLYYILAVKYNTINGPTLKPREWTSTFLNWLIAILKFWSKERSERLGCKLCHQLNGNRRAWDLIGTLIIWPAAAAILCKSLICSTNSLVLCRSIKWLAQVSLPIRCKAPESWPCLLQI